MKLRLALLAATLVLLFAPFTRAESCNTVIIDKAGVISNPSIIANAARPLINQGADVHVIIVDSISGYSVYGSGLAGVEAYFEQVCPTWIDSSTGQRKANLFVIMVAPNDRVKNIFLGSYYNGAFDITSTYSQLANSYFKNRQWEAGIASTLQGTTTLALNYHQRIFAQQRQRTLTTPTYTSAPTPQNSDSGISVLVIFLLVWLVLGIIGTIYYFVFRKRSDSSSSTDSYGADTIRDPYNLGTPPVAATSSRPRTYAAAAPSHTTVINNDNSGNGLLTGLVVGEMLSRPNTPSYGAPSAPVYVEPSQPTYVEPTPTQDAPDSTWEAPTAAPDTSFGDSSSSDSSSSDSSSSDSSFGDSSSSDSSFGGGDSGGSSDSSF